MSKPAMTEPSSAQINILMYHQVGRFPEPKQHRASYCDIDRFRAQMAWLKRCGYQVISLSQAYAALYEQADLPGRAVVLTFDDGYLNFAEQAYPVLQAHGYPAVLFAVSGLLGKPARWLSDGGINAPLLSAQTLRELHAGGVEIGAHSVTHPRLSQLGPADCNAEIIDSKHALEDVVDAPVEFFAYPYGDYDPEVRDAVMSAGYKAALTCSRGPAYTAPNAYELPRKAVSWGDSLVGFFWKLAFKNRRKDRYA